MDNGINQELYKHLSDLVQYAMEIEMVTGYRNNRRPDMLSIVRLCNKIKEEQDFE